MYKEGNVTFKTLEAKQKWLLDNVINAIEYIGTEGSLSVTEEELKKVAIKNINKVKRSIK